MDNQPLPSGFFSAETRHLLDTSAKTERRYVEAAQERARQLNEANAAAGAAATAIDAERRTAASQTDAELRVALQQAIDGYDSALNDVGIAEANTALAKERMDLADAELADYSDLDQQIANWHVDQIKQHLDKSLPATLQAAESQRGQLIDRIATNHRVHAILADELKDAQRRLADSAAHRARVASQVIAKHVDVVASEMNAAMDRVIDLRRMLVSAGAVWIAGPDGTAPLGLSSIAREAVWKQLPDVKPDTSTVDTIRSWHSRLLNDSSADATLTDEPS